MTTFECFGPHNRDSPSGMRQFRSIPYIFAKSIRIETNRIWQRFSRPVLLAFLLHNSGLSPSRSVSIWHDPACQIDWDRDRSKPDLCQKMRIVLSTNSRAKSGLSRSGSILHKQSCQISGDPAKPFEIRAPKHSKSCQMKRINVSGMFVRTPLGSGLICPPPP